jgi:hypothetical protein
MKTTLLSSSHIGSPTSSLLLLLVGVSCHITRNLWFHLWALSQTSSFVPHIFFIVFLLYASITACSWDTTPISSLFNTLLVLILPLRFLFKFCIPAHNICMHIKPWYHCIILSTIFHISVYIKTVKQVKSKSNLYSFWDAKEISTSKEDISPI